MECRELNALYRKNESYDEIKSHHYIISFDPKDAAENGLTGEQEQQIGMEYLKKNFPGHQALVCTHMDGHNGSGNIHVHIVITAYGNLMWNARILWSGSPLPLRSALSERLLDVQRPAIPMLGISIMLPKLT